MISIHDSSKILEEVQGNLQEALGHDYKVLQWFEGVSGKMYIAVHHLYTKKYVKMEIPFEVIEVANIDIITLSIRRELYKYELDSKLEQEIKYHHESYRNLFNICCECIKYKIDDLTGVVDTRRYGQAIQSLQELMAKLDKYDIILKERK